MKRWLPHIGIAVGVCIAVYALFFTSSDEDEIRALLEQLEQSVKVTEGDTNQVLRGARLKREFSEIFIKDVGIEIPELTTISAGRMELVGLATRAPMLYRRATVNLDGLTIEIDSEGLSAAATGDAVLTASRQSGETERDTRDVLLRLDKIDDSWRIVSLTVSTRQDERL